jgi:dipeptidyl aminopeptidase/acylaminoacyl peptidase
MRRLLLLLSVLLLAAGPARSAAPPALPPWQKWVPDDVVRQEFASDFQLSPGGRYAAFVRTSADLEKNEHVGQVFRLDLRTGREVQLTRSAESCTGPQWSPDGAWLAFLSDRPAKAGDDKTKGKAQVWLLDPTGGEAWPLTACPRGVQRFGWAGPGAVLFAAQEDAGRRETALKDDRKDASHVVEDEPHEPPVRLFRADVRTKKVARLTDNRDRTLALAVSPDGKHAVVGCARSMRYTYDNKVKPAWFLVDTATGRRRRVLGDPRLNVGAVRWSPDGKGFYATDETSSKPELAQAGLTELVYHDVATGAEGRIDLGWPRGLEGQRGNDGAPGVVPLADGFLALLADGVRPRAARYTRAPGKAGFTRQWLTGTHARNLFGMASDAAGGTLLYAHSTASSPTRWYRARLDGARITAERPIAPCNAYLDRKRKARVEVVRWAGGGGDEVEGLLFYPHEGRPQKKAPLVVQIHGGPASADHDGWEERWSYAPNLLCQRGAFVLKLNYHGSTGYGLPWMESISGGRYCEPELQDVEKGIDALVARGLADPARVGLQGWSNGAILTNVLITRSTRYKAAVAGAGTVEYVSDWASCEFGEAFDRYYLAKSPLEDLPLYVRKSPFHRFDRVRTPTLILFGTEDRVVHPQQGWAQYRALQQLGKAPVRFVLFPGEKHGLTKLSHQKRKLEEEMAWFDRYLFGLPAGGDEAVKADSPLGWLLKRQAARKHGGRYGVMTNGVLAPETVKHGALAVGRFEVTRAQLAAFTRQAVEAGKENHPAAGVTYEQAAAYCAWLSKRTGKAYRLPTAREGETLYGGAAAGDNTLDRWAGYAVNPDDAARLREKLGALAGPAPLLEEVGRGRGTGEEELVFDLGGNVAEWVTGPDGKGVLRGGSADTPADPRGGLQAAPAYRGFRVVLE